MSDSAFQKVRVTEYEVVEDVTDQAQKFAPVCRQDDFDDDFGGQSEEEPEADLEPKRFLVVLRALLPGLGGYVTRTYEVEITSDDSIDDVEPFAEHEMEMDPTVPFGIGPAEIVSVTEL